MTSVRQDLEEALRQYEEVLTFLGKLIDYGHI